MGYLYFFLKAVSHPPCSGSPNSSHFPVVLGGEWLQSHSLEQEVRLPVGTVVPLFVHGVLPCKDQFGKPRHLGSAWSIIKHMEKIQVRSVPAPGALCLAGSILQLGLTEP